MFEDEIARSQGLLEHVARLLGKGSIIEDESELIMAVFMILLRHPAARNSYHIVLSHELTTKIEDKLLDKICAVISKTHIIKGEKATLNDDTALEIITDYLLEYDEFIFYKNEKRILRKPTLKKSKRRKNKESY
jgi:hypothetical protein